MLQGLALHAVLRLLLGGGEQWLVLRTPNQSMSQTCGVFMASRCLLYQELGEIGWQSHTLSQAGEQTERVRLWWWKMQLETLHK